MNTEDRSQSRYDWIVKDREQRAIIMQRPIIILFIAFLPLTAYGQQKRDSWYIGFGVGAGPASLTEGGDVQTFSEYMRKITNEEGTRAGLNFNVGATVSRHLLLGVELAGVNQAVHMNTGRVQLAHTQLLLAGTWFPTGTGAFLKAGVGQGAVSLRVETDRGDREAREVGLGSMLGIGYAFWLGQSANLVLGADLHYAVLEGTERGAPTQSQFTLLYVGCSWF